jgi:hypothetical protein
VGLSGPTISGDKRHSSQLIARGADLRAKR